MRKYYNSVVRKDNAIFVRFCERNSMGSLDGVIKKTEMKVWGRGLKWMTRLFKNQKITADWL